MDNPKIFRKTCNKKRKRTIHKSRTFIIQNNKSSIRKRWITEAKTWIQSNNFVKFPSLVLKTYLLASKCNPPIKNKAEKQARAM